MTEGRTEKWGQKYLGHVSKFVFFCPHFSVRFVVVVVKWFIRVIGRILQLVPAEGRAGKICAICGPSSVASVPLWFKNVNRPRPLGSGGVIINANHLPWSPACMLREPIAAARDVAAGIRVNSEISSTKASANS